MGLLRTNYRLQFPIRLGVRLTACKHNEILNRLKVRWRLLMWLRRTFAVWVLDRGTAVETEEGVALENARKRVENTQQLIDGFVNRRDELLQQTADGTAPADAAQNLKDVQDALYYQTRMLQLNREEVKRLEAQLLKQD